MNLTTTKEYINIPRGGRIRAKIKKQTATGTTETSTKRIQSGKRHRSGKRGKLSINRIHEAQQLKIMTCINFLGFE